MEEMKVDSVGCRDSGMEAMDADEQHVPDQATDRNELPMTAIDVNAEVEATPNHQQLQSANTAPMGCVYYVPGNCMMRGAVSHHMSENEDSRSQTRHHQRQWGYMDHYFSAGHWF